MLLLVFTNRYEVGLIKQNVGSHQHRIVEQADADILALLARLVFELSHSFQFRQTRRAIQNPGQFGVLSYVRLYEDGRDWRSQADCEVDTREFSCFSRESLGILRQ